MFRKGPWILFGMLFFSAQAVLAQPCNSSTAPVNLESTYIPGEGALLKWDAIPGSQGVYLNGYFPTGFGFYRRVNGFELDRFKVPESELGLGYHTWRVFAACSSMPPFDATPYSVEAFFNRPGEIECHPAFDGEGNEYPAVPIGTQCWLAQSLRTRVFLNGDTIPMLVSDSLWSHTNGPAVAYSNNDSTQLDVYGLLYNWHTVVDSRGLCPAGWRVSSDQDWSDLSQFLGGIPGALLKTPGNISDGTGLWLAPNSFGNNITGFTANPSGIRNLIGVYAQFQRRAFFWTTDGIDSDLAYHRLLTYLENNIGRLAADKNNGFSVRCIQE